MYFKTNANPIMCNAITALTVLMDDLDASIGKQERTDEAEELFKEVHGAMLEPYQKFNSSDIDPHYGAAVIKSLVMMSISALCSTIPNGEVNMTTGLFHTQENTTELNEMLAQLNNFGANDGDDQRAVN
jgi:hypothetical protein